MKPSVLILCTGNFCRSQMAEGLLRAAVGDAVDVFSAGVKPAGRIHPRAITAMAEIGIDLSGHASKHVGLFLERPITAVISVCGNADEACPTFPGRVRRHHWGFRDPAHFEGSEEAIVAEFRAVRDEMKRVFDAYAAGWRDSLRDA
jgi:arsenate reductase